MEVDGVHISGTMTCDVQRRSGRSRKRETQNVPIICERIERERKNRERTIVRKRDSLREGRAKERNGRRERGLQEKEGGTDEVTRNGKHSCL